MGLKLIPDDLHIPFTKFRMVAAVISLAAMIASVGALLTLNLNFGIDFRGGVTVEVGPGEGNVFEDADLTTVRSAVAELGLGNVQAKMIGGTGGAPDGIAVTAELQPVEEAAEGEDDDGVNVAAERRQMEVAERMQDILRQTLGEQINFRRVDVVGPAVSGELVQAGISALFIAVGMMLVYIWFRFEWQFSLGAVLALIHDVTITLGVFAVTQLEFTLSIIAALLTIIGYSMNDTVIVYDRIRENLRKFKTKPLAEVVDLSINQTLSRTLMTSFTTLIALFALFFLGGDVLRGFSFAIIFGILVGTYSSIFIASPILLQIGVKRDWSKEGAKSTAVRAP
jgi:preprotein translocase SecF subunit